MLQPSGDPWLFLFGDLAWNGGNAGYPVNGLLNSVRAKSASEGEALGVPYRDMGHAELLSGILSIHGSFRPPVPAVPPRLGHEFVSDR